MTHRNSYKNILVIQTAFLGDFLLTLPLLAAIRKTNPEAVITVLARPFAAVLLSGTGFVPLVYDKNGKEKGVLKLFSKIADVRKLYPELVISPHLSLRSALISFLSGAPERRGFKKSPGKIFYNRLFDYDFFSGEHYSDKLMKLLPEYAGIRENEFKFSFDAQAEKNAELLLKNLPRPVGIGIGSEWPIKRLPAKTWAQVIELLLQKGLTPVLIGTEKEKKDASAIISLYKNLNTRNLKVAATGNPGSRRLEPAPDLLILSTVEKIIDLTGKTDMRLLLSVVKRLSAFVSNDTGVMHLAALMKKPVTAVFGPTVKKLGFYPFSAGSEVIEKELDCRPCGLHGARKCGNNEGRLCLEIAPEKIAESVIRQVESIAGR